MPEKYTVVEETSSAQLALTILELIQLHWQPIGGVSTYVLDDCVHYVQAMVRYPIWG